MASGDHDATSAVYPDVHVIGAGLAGSLLAAKLAERVSVSIIEKRRPGRCRNCGGGMPEEAFQRLGLDVPVVKVDRVVLSVNDRLVEFPCRYVVTDRVELDRASRDKALRAGATSTRGEFTGVDVEKRRFRYLADGRVIERGYETLVLAHGFKPRGGAVPGLNDTAARRHAVARLQVLAGESPYPDALFIRVEGKVRDGYSWIFPMPGKRMNVGSGALADNYDPRHLETFKATLRLDGAVLDAGGGRLPMAPARRVRSGDVILFGDAAGMVYPLNGEGLAHVVEFADRWVDGILDGGDLNAIWRRSRTYWKLRLGETALSTLSQLENWFNLPLYPLVSAISAWRRRFG